MAIGNTSPVWAWEVNGWMAVREYEVEGYLVRRVVGVGGRCEKFIPEVRNGWPDRIVLLPDGVMVWVETKKPKGGKLDPLQIHAHKILRGLGQRVEIVWTKAEADRLIEELTGGEKATSPDR